MEMNADALKRFANGGTDMPPAEEEGNPNGEEVATEETPMAESESWVAAAATAVEKVKEAVAAVDEAASAAEMCPDCPADLESASQQLADTVKESLEVAVEIHETAEEIAVEVAEEAADELEEIDEGEPAAEGGEVNPTDAELADVAAAEVEAGEADPDMMAEMEGYDPEVHGNPPAWVASESTWDAAKKAVDPEGKGTRYREPYAVVAHVYQKMGGGKK